jgi:small-conductance mechanosensitive channel
MPIDKKSVDKGIKSSQLFFEENIKFILLIIIVGIWYYFRNSINESQLVINIMLLLFLYFFISIVLNYLKWILIYIYLRKHKLSKNTADNFTIGITRLAFFLNHFVFILFFIHIMIINLQNLLTSLSLFAVALAILFREYLMNFASGIMLIFSKDFRLKDYVKVGESKGRIVDFTFQNVNIKNDSGDIIYVPNSMFLSKEIINFSKTSLKNMKIESNIFAKKIKKSDEFAKNMENIIFKKFEEFIGDRKNIIFSLEKIEKDIMSIQIEILLVKNPDNTERIIKTYILSEINKKVN